MQKPINYKDMKAYTKYKYGGPEVLKLEDVDVPVVKEGHLLVKVKANSANPADYRILRGKPFIARFTTGLFKPKQKIPGADFAGEVIQAGEGVKRFKVGDRVFGETLMGGAFAEYVSVPENVCASMPGDFPFEVMASVPVAGFTALQALVTHGKIKPGENILINGASGGVGHYAVQIAKALGARVTAVCSERNIGFVKQLGADEVIAYDKEDLSNHAKRYDMVLDTHGNMKYEVLRRLADRAVVTGFTSMAAFMKLSFKKSKKDFPLEIFTAQANEKDLEILASLVKDGAIIPQIERTYDHTQVPQAISYIEQRRTRGKVVMVWNV